MLPVSRCARPERVDLSLIVYGFVVNDCPFDFRVVAVFDLFTVLDIAHGKPKRRLTLLVLGDNLL